MKFHGNWSAPISLSRAVSWSSMELGVRQFRSHGQFHGIPGNLECANSADTSNSMEFHGTWRMPISLTREVPWNSMDLYAPISMTRTFQWSFMEFRGPWTAPISLTRAVSWNSSPIGSKPSIYLHLMNIYFPLHWMTHWGQMTQIGFSKLTTLTDSVDGLSPGRRLVIIWTEAVIVLTGPLWTNLIDILIESHRSWFNKMHFVAAFMC